MSLNCVRCRARSSHEFRHFIRLLSIVVTSCIAQPFPADLSASVSFTVEIISVGNLHSSSTISSLPYTAPAMSVALEELRKSFNSSVRFQHSLIYDVRYHTCPEFTDNVDKLVADYYYKRRNLRTDMTVFIAAGCTERLNMAKLIRGWNLFMMIGGTAESVFRDKELYSNVVISGNNAVKSYVQLFKLLLVRFRWSTLSIVLNSSATPFHSFLGASLRTELAKIFSLKFTQIRKDYPDYDFRQTLRNIQLNSRVVLLLGFADRLRYFMLQARSLNMTNGNYVYLAAEPFHHRTFYGNLTWSYFDSFNKEAREAYQTLLVITSPKDDMKNLRQLNLEEEFKRRSAQDFNLTYADDEKPNPFVTACYESIILFAIVLKELLLESTPGNFNDGSLTARRFLNRTFTLDTGPVTFDEVGERQQPLVVQQFQANAVWPLTIMTLDACAESFNDTRRVVWPVEFPPPNEPACGFYGTRGSCRITGTSINISIIAGGSLASVVCAAILMWAVQWGLRKRANEISAWDSHQIDCQKLHFFE